MKLFFLLLLITTCNTLLSQEFEPCPTILVNRATLFDTQTENKTIKTLENRDSVLIIDYGNETLLKVELPDKTIGFLSENYILRNTCAKEIIGNRKIQPPVVRKTNYKSSSSGNKVYRCGNSKVYHPYRYHNALSRCKSGIISFSLSEAKRMGLRSCQCVN